jgi:hypothetical protein
MSDYSDLMKNYASAGAQDLPPLCHVQDGSGEGWRCRAPDDRLGSLRQRAAWHVPRGS